jgi:hypothetical protein
MLLGGVLALGAPACIADPLTLPTEVDTIVARRTVVLTEVQGEILRKTDDGSLVPVAEGESVSPGEILLVRRGASFNIGSDTIGAEHHGDRWVRFQ